MSPILNKVCLNAEGKVQIRNENSKNTFNYTAQIDPLKKVWQIGLEIPLKGEESLMLSWLSYPHEAIKIEGTLIEKYGANQVLGLKSEELDFELVAWLELVSFIKKQNSAVKKVKCWAQNDTKETKNVCRVELWEQEKIDYVIFKQFSTWIFERSLSAHEKIQFKLNFERENHFEDIEFLMLKSTLQKDEYKPFSMAFKNIKCL